MIIGVDTGALSVTDERLKVGVWRVTFSLLKELSKLDNQNEYRLYSFLPIDRGVMESFGPRMKNIVIRPAIGWSALRLPLELRLHPVDVFLGLSQILPSSSSHNIGFIYDLGFLHHPEVYPGSLMRLKKQTQQVVERANQIVTISRVTKADIEKNYAAHHKPITVAYPGVGEQFKSPGAKYQGKNPYFLFVGALKRGKNIPFLIRSFAQFLRKAPRVYDLLLVGGDYWLDPEIDETIETLKLSGRVKLLGFVSDEVLPSYYRGAVTLVSPSLVEGFCLPVVEAMACGCPVIASEIPAMKEIAGEAGMFVDPTSHESLTEALAKITDPLLRSKLSTAGLKQAKHYSWHNMAEKVLELCHEA